MGFVFVGKNDPIVFIRFINRISLFTVSCGNSHIDESIMIVYELFIGK